MDGTCMLATVWTPNQALQSYDKEVGIGLVHTLHGSLTQVQIHVRTIYRRSDGSFIKPQPNADCTCEHTSLEPFRCFLRGLRPISDVSLFQAARGDRNFKHKGRDNVPRCL